MHIVLRKLGVMFLVAALLVGVATVALIVAAARGRVQLRACCEPIGADQAPQLSSDVQDGNLAGSELAQ